MSSPDDLQLLRSVAGLTTARVADTLDSFDCRHQVCAPVLHPVSRGLRAIGRAVTVAFEIDDGPDDPIDPYAAMIELVDSLRDGDFVVIAANGDERTAYWGLLFSAAAAGHGAVGVVCDGVVMVPCVLITEVATVALARSRTEDRVLERTPRWDFAA